MANPEQDFALFRFQDTLYFSAALQEIKHNHNQSYYQQDMYPTSQSVTTHQA
jgi:hypothetical protein